MAEPTTRRDTPVVSVVGHSGVGKTTFLEKLIAVLKARGYRLACIKHDVHNFEVDHPGKDTWRLAQAGGDAVMIASPEKMALIEKVEREPTLADLVAMASDRVDIVLTEGYRSAATLKIEVSRRAARSPLVSPADQLLALVTDQTFPLSVPQFDLDDASGVADLLERWFHPRPQGATP
jgi:molybdopterin-guanine dinucleotide biosynthesis protein B